MIDPSPIHSPPARGLLARLGGLRAALRRLGSLRAAFRQLAGQPAPTPAADAARITQAQAKRARRAARNLQRAEREGAQP